MERLLEVNLRRHKIEIVVESDPLKVLSTAASFLPDLILVDHPSNKALEEQIVNELNNMGMKAHSRRKFFETPWRPPNWPQGPFRFA